ncbi:hypothetical protein LINPERHAP1_LOCUS18519 [Linum perenne]
MQDLLHNLRPRRHSHLGQNVRIKIRLRQRQRQNRIGRGSTEEADRGGDRVCFHGFKRPARDSIVYPAPRSPTLQDGIGKLHHRNDDGKTLHPPIKFVDSKRRGNYYAFKRAPSSRPLFNWSDHPSLITDAVENGWSRFGFTVAAPSQLPSSSPSVRSSILLGLCAAGDYYYYRGGGGRETLPPAPKISWEVSQASANFMQKIRLNSGLKRVSLSNSSTSAGSVIRTAHPLLGPPLGNNINSVFPQEAYFEITILYSRSGGGGGEEYHQNSRRSSSAAASGKGKNGKKRISQGNQPFSILYASNLSSYKATLTSS